MIYLRPTPKVVPVRYTEIVEKSGLVVSEKHSVALYTCSSGAKQGPAGPTGAPGAPYLYDTIIASCSDEYSPLEVDLVNPATTFRAPFAINIAQVRISLTTANTGTDVIVDLKMNGTTIFSTLLHIDSGDKTSVGSATPAVLSVTAVPDDAEFLVYITQIGATIAGTGLKIAVTGTKVVV